KHNAARPAGALDGVRDGAALEIDAEHVLARVLGGFFDGRRHFVSLAVADADIATTIAGDDQRAEAERAAALDDLGAAVDADDGAFDATLIGGAFLPAAAAALPARTAAALSPAATALLPLMRLLLLLVLLL